MEVHSSKVLKGWPSSSLGPFKIMPDYNNLNISTQCSAMVKACSCLLLFGWVTPLQKSSIPRLSESQMH